jgi:hypothetical protein
MASMDDRTEYVPDQYAEREFYGRFGFTSYYEGDEFPGFLAVQNGEAIIGLQRASDDQPVYREGLRWQFEVDTAGQLESIIDACQAYNLDHEVVVETGGTRFKTRLVKVRSPAGHLVWFEVRTKQPLDCLSGPCKKALISA